MTGRARFVAWACVLTSCGGKAVDSEPTTRTLDEDPPPAEPSGVGGAVLEMPPPSTGGSGSRQEPLDTCVFDEETGLMWEPLSDEPGTHSYRGATYTWYDSRREHNGGDPGVEDGGDCAFPPCDTQGHVTWTNGFRLCGAADWRMPRTEELLFLAEQDGRMLSGEEPFYWAAESYDEPSAAWGAYLCCGGVTAPSIKSGAGFVRLVRSAP